VEIATVVILGLGLVILGAWVVSVELRFQTIQRAQPTSVGHIPPRPLPSSSPPKEPPAPHGWQPPKRPAGEPPVDSPPKNQNGVKSKRAAKSKRRRSA